MLINIYANRSLNDINQSPVFPWIITNYSENDYSTLLNDQNLIRPFGVPIEITGNERAENVLESIDEIEITGNERAENVDS